MTQELEEIFRTRGQTQEDITDIMKGIDDFIADLQKPTPTELPTTYDFEPYILSPEEATDYGVTLEEGWSLEVSPSPDKLGVSTTLIDSAGWRITDTGEYTSPEGEVFSAEELQTLAEMPELWERIRLEMIKINRYVEPAEYMRFDLETERHFNLLPEMYPGAFLDLIHQIGHTEDTEALLKAFGYEDRDIEKFFGERYQWITKEITIPFVGWVIPFPDVTWPGWLQTIVGGEVGKGGILGAIEWVAAPWNSIWYATHNLMHAESQASEIGRQFREAIDKSLWNPFIIFSDDFQSLGYAYAEEHLYPWQRISTDLLNPAWFAPIGLGIGVAANVFKTVPIFGTALRGTAAATLTAERVLTWPIAKLLKLTTYPVRKITAPAVEAIIRRNKHVENPWDILPFDEMIAGELVDNWQRTLIQTISKVRPARWVIERGFGWKILIKRQSIVIEDIVGKGAVGWGHVVRQGVGASSVKAWEFMGIIKNPVKYFGLNERAFSQTMLKRLLPKYRGIKNGGTLEHFFTKTEMYNWKGMEDGLRYVRTLGEMNREVLSLLTKEGVQPKHLLDDWFHRVVEGRYDLKGKLIPVKGRPGQRLVGRRIGGKAAYEMPRMFETMEEGIAWGIKYNRDPLVSITSYVREAYRKIADARFIEYVAKELDAIGKAGVTPLEQLAKRFPELVEEITTAEGRRLVTATVLKQQELADARRFSDVVNRAIRGEKIPKQTLDAIERRFPDQGRRLRAILEAKSEVEQSLRLNLEGTRVQLREVQELLARKETAGASEAIAKGIDLPSEKQLIQAFEVLPYEDRAMFRSFVSGQRSDLERLIAEQTEEIAGLKEFLFSDPVAIYKGQMGKRTVSLTAVLTPEGRWPETLTKNQAELLLMGREIKPTSLTKTGRVRWEYVTDELAEHFGMTEGEFIKHLESIRVARVTVKDLDILIAEAGVRGKQLDTILRAIETVDVQPKFIPRPEPGMPEPGIQKDIWGYETPVYPKGKGDIVQISMDDYAKLVELHKKAGLPPPDVAIKPKIEGIKGFEAETRISKAWTDLAPPKTAAQLKTEFTALRKEVNAIAEARKIPYWDTRAEVAFRMEQMRVPGLEQGYIMQPFAGGKMYGRDFIDAFNRFFGHESGIGALRVTSDAAGILRITKAALDLSWSAIQGMPTFGLAHAYLLVDPTKGVRLMGSWYKAQLYGMCSLFDPGLVGKYLLKNNSVVMQRITYGGTARSIDYFATLEATRGLAGAASRGMARLPFKPYHRAEAAWFGASEMTRNEFWRILSPKAIGRGQGFECARFLDRITGITEAAAMGVPLTVRQIEQTFMWFAPNYTRACLTVLADLFRGGYTGSQARMAIGGMIGAGTLMYAGAQFSIATLQGKSPEEAWNAVLEGFCVYQDPITGEWEWRPSARFMTLQLENYNLGFGGFWYGLLRLSGNIMACIEEIGDKEIVDLVRIFKHGSFNKRDNPFIYWWFSRASPLFGMGFELAAGKDFLGYPIESPADYAAYILTRFEPIWAEQGLNWMIPGLARDNEVPEDQAKFILPIAEIFGLRTFPEGMWNRFYDKVNEVLPGLPDEVFADYFTEEELQSILDARDAGKLTWRQLPDALQWHIRVAYPEINDMYELAVADSFLRDSQVWKQWTGRIEEEKEAYYKRGDYLWGQLISGEIDMRELRELWSTAGQIYGAALEAIENEPNYEVIYNYFQKRQEEGDKYDWSIALALIEYQRIMFADYTDENGDMDWDARDAAVANYIKKYGDDTYQLLRNMYADKRLVEGLEPTLIRLAEDRDKLRDYWQLPWKPIIQLEEDEVPAKYMALWQSYQNLKTDAERDAFLERHSDLAKDWRIEYRLAHPEDDARLALWGYGGKLQSIEAYNYVLQFVSELGLSLSQMQLRLPPENIIEDYFAYNEIIMEFGGSSTQAKLFRLEHPEWDEWGQSEEGYGWNMIETHPESLRISVKWAELDQLYTDAPGITKEERDAWRAAILAQNPEYAIDRRRRDAYDIEFPEEIIEDYVNWYITPWSGWEDDWFLMEHPEFYQAALQYIGWEPRDFSKIPTREVGTLVDTYFTLEPGDDRLKLRCQNPQLDIWFVEVEGYKPCWGTDRCIPFGGETLPPQPPSIETWGVDGWTKWEISEYEEYLRRHFPGWGGS